MVQMKRRFETATGWSIPLVEPPASTRQIEADGRVPLNIASD